METFENRATSSAFFTVVLPGLGKDLEKGLSGQFVLSCGMFKKQRNSALPQFLYEHFIQVFHKDGTLKDNPVHVRDLRQLCMMFYKFEVPFTDDQLKKATEKYIETDKLVKTSDFPYGLQEVRKNFCSLFPDNPLDIRPHHSNGATADSVTNPDKRSVRRHIPSLMKVYGPRFFFNSELHAKNWCSTFSTVTAEPNARLTFVPKDSRGPRSICMEPHERMFIQKGLQVKLYDYIENYSPAKGFINFTNQGVNQRLAYESSMTRLHATIDLKDASDMVSWSLLRLLAPSEWFVALQATRSACVELPDKTVLPLNKYASMGSALCFPIEAMVFWSIAKTVTPKVWVYGDDIIVDNNHVADVIHALESYGLIINHDKTLHKGFFRESCGGDYLHGHDISYIKCKSYSLNRYVAFCNLFTERYGVELATKFIKIFEFDENIVIQRQPLSFSTRPRSYIFYTDDCSSAHVFFQRRYNADLQRYEVRCLADSFKQDDSRVNEYDKFFSWLTISNTDVAPEEDAYLRTITSDLNCHVYDMKRRFSSFKIELGQQKLIYGLVKPRPKFTWDVLTDVLR
jgi:hypothetical protein